MGKKLIVSLLCLFSFQMNSFGFSLDEKNISMYALVVDENIPEEASRNLETKLQNILSVQGIADKDYVDRFVFTAKMDVISKDVLPTTPVRISQKMDITFIVGDVIENKVFGTKTITLSGIGTTETKLLNSAFSRINSKREDLQEMLSEAKEKIVDYYSNNCVEIIERANTMSTMQQYDAAIHSLISVPNICTACFLQCQSAAETIYKRKIEYEATVLLKQAQTEWMKQPNAEGARKVAPIIHKINPYSSIYSQVEDLRNEISNILQEDERKEWEFQMKKYEDSQAFKMSIVEACRAIGVAWGQGQPQSVTKTIIRSWW